MVEDNDPFSEFGGKEVKSSTATKSDPFSEFGGTEVKKKVSSPVLNNTSQPLNTGGQLDPVSLQNTLNATAPLAPVTDKQLRTDIQVKDDAIRQQKLQQQEQLSNNLKKIRTAMPESDRANIDKAINIVSTRQSDRLTAPTKEEQAHNEFMDSTAGKVLGGVAYLGSKATKGTLQIAKGVSHLVELANDPMKFATGQESATDGVFKKADELANYGLTKSDVSNIEEGTGMGKHALAGIGMMAEFAPSIALGEATAAPKAVFYLQGLGQGKDLSDSLKKQGKDLNPLAKEALIQGSGFVNMILSDLGDNLYGKLPSVARGKIATGIVADAIKESAGKDLTYDSFKTLLDKGARTFADKFEKAPLEILNKYNHTAATLGGLNVANFAVHKGVDKINDTPVFNETAGDLAEGLVKTVTQEAPLFTALGAVPEITRLTPYSGYKNDVVESIVHDPSKENIEAIKSQIANHGSEQGWSQEEMAGSLQHIEQIGAATRKLPNDITSDKKSDAMGLIIDRDGLTKKLKQIQEGKQELDPAIADVPTAQEQYLTDKIEQANDKIRSIVTGKKVTYSKDEENTEKPKFFKTIDGKQENIEQSRYDLEKTERQLKTTTNEQPLQPENDKVNTELLPDKQKETSVNVPDEAVKPIVDPTRQHAIDAITHGVLIPENGKSGETSARFDFGMTTAEKKKGVADITKGNYETAPAKRLIEKVMEMEAKDAYPIIEGTGGTTIRNRAATSAEIKQHLEDAKASKIGKLTKQQIEEINKPLQDLGFTHQDFIDYENSRNEQRGTGRPSESSDGRAVESVTEPIQQSANDKTASKPQDTGSKATQGKSGDQVKPITSLDENGKSAKQSLSDVETQRKAELRKKFLGQLNDITRIPTLLADKEFREYAGLIFKEAAGDFKSFSKELIESVGEKIREHLPQLHKELEKEYAKQEETAPTETTGIKHADTKKEREEAGIGEYEKISKTEAELNAQADKAMAGGYDINKLISKIEKGDLPSDIENTIAKRYISSLAAAIAETPTSELLAQRIRLINAFDKSGSELGRALASRQGTVVKENNLANFLYDEMASRDVSELSQPEINKLKTEWEQSEAAKAKFDEGCQKAVDEFNKKKAQQAIDREKKVYDREKGRGSKKTHADYVKERSDIIEQLKKDFQKSFTKTYATIPGAPQFASIAPHVSRLVKSLVAEGVTNVADIVKSIHNDLKDVVEGIKEGDIRDIISGVYKKTNTKNEIASQIRDIQTQIKLENKIQDLENGIRRAKSEGSKTQMTREVEALRNQIKEIELRNIEELGAEDNTRTDEQKRQTIQSTLKTKLAKLKHEYENSSFEDIEPPQKIKLPPEILKLQDEYIALQKKVRLRRDKAYYDRLPKWERYWDKFTQLLGVRRIVQTAIDLSMPFRQGITVTLNPRAYGIGLHNFKSVSGLLSIPKNIVSSPSVKSWGNMFKTVFSQKGYDRMMYDMEQTPIYRNMVEDKVKFNEIEASDNNNRNEDFRTSFVYEIPYLREPLLASNRAAAGFINTARYELYAKGSRSLERQGVTRENSPKDYQALGNWVNTVTGRGSFIKGFEENPTAQRLLGNTFYGARLMASRFNMLNPRYYYKMPKAMKIEALKDIGGYATTAVITALALKAATGGTITIDPDDADFMKLKIGNKRYDVVSGGTIQYIRTYLRIAKAVYLRANPEISKKKADKYSSFASMSVKSFFQYKLAPNTSYAISAFNGKDPLGKDFNKWDIAKIYPMYADDMIESWKADGGATATMAILAPSIFGVGVQNYKERPKR